MGGYRAVPPAQATGRGAPPLTPCGKHGLACRRYSERLRRRARPGGCRRRIQLIEPPLETCITAVPRRRRTQIRTFGLVRRTTEGDVHMGGVRVPGADQAQPGPIAGDLLAQLPLDRWIDQDPIDFRQARRQSQKGRHAVIPAAGFHAAPIRSDQARLLERFPLGVRQWRPWPHIQADIHLQPTLVTDMSTPHWSAARMGDVTDHQFGQTGRRRSLTQQFNTFKGLRRAPYVTLLHPYGGEADTAIRQALSPDDTTAGRRAADNAQRPRDRRRRTRGADQKGGETKGKKPDQNRRSRMVMTSPGRT